MQWTVYRVVSRHIVILPNMLRRAFIYHRFHCVNQRSSANNDDSLTLLWNDDLPAALKNSRWRNHFKLSLSHLLRKHSNTKAAPPNAKVFCRSLSHTYLHLKFSLSMFPAHFTEKVRICKFQSMLRQHDPLSPAAAIVARYHLPWLLSDLLQSRAFPWARELHWSIESENPDLYVHHEVNT